MEWSYFRRGNCTNLVSVITCRRYYPTLLASVVKCVSVYSAHCIRLSLSVVNWVRTTCILTSNTVCLCLLPPHIHTDSRTQTHTRISLAHISYSLHLIPCAYSLQTSLSAPPPPTHTHKEVHTERGVAHTNTPHLPKSLYSLHLVPRAYLRQTTVSPTHISLAHVIHLLTSILRYSFTV